MRVILKLVKKAQESAIRAMFATFVLLISVGIAEAQEQISVGQNSFDIEAARMEILNEYKPMDSNHIDVGMEPSPAVLIDDWLRRTFKANGDGENILRFKIMDASIVESEIKSDSWFSSDSLKYTARFVVSMTIVSPENKVISNAVSKAWGARTISDNTSIEERENLVAEMSNVLLENLGNQVINEIQTGFTKYLR